MTTKKLMFDPSDPKVTYVNKFIAQKNRKHPNRMPKLIGPYWYAYFATESKNFNTQYLGKTLPPECEPYVKDKTLATTYRNKSVGDVKMEWSVEPILEILDHTGRVFIDIPKLAAEAQCYYDEVGPSRYVIYRP